MSEQPTLKLGQPVAPKVALFIGIDPGKSGGIAALHENGDVALAVAMPQTERDILNTLLRLAMRPEPGGAKVQILGMLERVRSSPQMGVVSSWTFGVGYGGLRMALTAARIAFDEVTPQKWQGYLGCRTGGDKNVSKAKAQDLFPTVKMTHALADAILLAEYCRRVKKEF